jgi:hypothetical protein
VTWPRLRFHHRHYESLGNESTNDLEALCVPCHRIADAERRETVEAARFWKRMNGWACKVYGVHWQDYKDEDDVAEAFNNWLERKGLE